MPSCDDCHDCSACRTVYKEDTTKINELKARIKEIERELDEKARKLKEVEEELNREKQINNALLEKTYVQYKEG